MTRRYVGLPDGWELISLHGCEFVMVGTRVIGWFDSEGAWWTGKSVCLTREELSAICALSRDMAPADSLRRAS